MRTQANKTYGFTLFELSLVVAIVSILATATLFAQGYINATNLAKTYQKHGQQPIAPQGPIMLPPIQPPGEGTDS